MKFLSTHQYKVVDVNKALVKFRKLMDERNKDPDKYPKIISGPYTLGDHDSLGVIKAFTIHEVDDPKQLLRLVNWFTPEISWKFTPIFESELTIPLWVEMKPLG